MSNVKIYTAVSEDLSPLIQGEGFCVDMVRYSDYADIEAKCAALAAENAALKESEREFDKMCAQEFGPDWVSEFTETQATDAFLAEVRAQGVEMFAKNAEGAEQGNGLMKAIARRAAKFAAQLRKGVQS